MHKWHGTSRTPSAYPQPLVVEQDGAVAPSLAHECRSDVGKVVMKNVLATMSLRLAPSAPEAAASAHQAELETWRRAGHLGARVGREESFRAPAYAVFS